jgi:protein TonB
MVTLRFPTSFLIALVLTSALFSGMWILISRSIDIGEIQRATKIEFTRLRRDSEVRTRVRPEKLELEKPMAVQDAPQIAIDMGVAGPAGQALDLLPPTVDARGAALSGLSFGGGGGGGRGAAAGGADRDVVPLVRIEPDYPARAAQRGIEGYVVVEFTITPAGTIKNARVLRAEPNGVFDAAALAAVSRWKYNPKVENGAAVARTGVRVKLNFQLENG